MTGNIRSPTMSWTSKRQAMLSAELKALLGKTPGVTAICVLPYHSFVNEVARMIRRMPEPGLRAASVEPIRQKWIKYGLQPEVLDRILRELFAGELPAISRIILP
jgi:hypothetical protein